ncbi:lipopolysaccharide biosynthesis protein [Qipengyuania spongiae]|uniref:Lipopolysaccharide biosynthesis protein n=1 Tax=Qipengyuania spongiae TaxID=2909673 RepID=A0ABY5SXQ0_9SPHN|nr:lipopolysaccharide biosynthesis protein [Qipengyuania spongiae]UVI39307.1 lipopolysaccharide biosynthesis protein [Qipengyuania spongiae]
MKRLFGNIGWLLGGRGFNAVLSLVYLALATRTLGLDGFGHFALIVALGQTVTGIANFQTWQFVVRWGAEDKGAQRAVGFAIALDLLSILVGALMSALLVWSIQFWLPLPDELLPLAFGFCVVSLLSIRTTPTGVLRLHFAYGRATAAEAVQPAIRAVGAGLAALLMPTVTGFILAWAAAEVGVALAIWLTAAKIEPVDWKEVSLKRLPREKPGAWKFVWAINFTGSLNIGGKQVMLLLVGALGGEALAGGFRVASQLGQALVQLAQAVSKAVYPELVHARDAAHDMARRIANIALVAGVIAVIAAIVLGRPGLALIAGPEFSGVYWAMVILAIAGAFELVGASLESLLVSAGKAHTAFLIRAVPTLLAFVLLQTSIDWMGLKGAGFAVLGSSALSVLGFWVAIISLQQIRITVDDAATRL